jgi:two-component sensor histidine kinase
VDNTKHLDRSEAPDRLKRGALILLGILWAFHFSVLWLRSYLREGPSDRSLLEGTLNRLALALFGAFLAYLIYRVLRGMRQTDFARQARIGGTLALLAALIQSVANMWLFETDPNARITDFIFYMMYWFWLLLAWTTAYLALSYSITIQEQERHAAELAVRAQEAQVRALRYQINPHFLFNTLNAIAALTRDAPAKAEEMVLQLSDFFRRSLAVNPMEDLSLAEEVDLQRLYLEIERTRFPDRISFEVALDHGTEEAKLPALLLQPLVENAVKHGVARSQGRTCISLRATLDGPIVEIVVENDAKSRGPAPRGEKVGLRNVSDRLHSRFGERATFSSAEISGGGFRNIIRIPLLA